MISKIFLLPFVLACVQFSSCTMLDNFSFWRSFKGVDAEERISLKGVHLDGPGLLNREVIVFGEIQLIGQFDTYVVIEEERVRMLVDLSRLSGDFLGQKLKQGRMLEVAGKVQSGENGHVYLVANAIRAG